MEQFEKWEKTFYKNHQGVHHFNPTCKMGWKAALKEVLKQNKRINRGSIGIVDWIDKELGDT